jgi:uncharacterized membrane protein
MKKVIALFLVLCLTGGGVFADDLVVPIVLLGLGTGFSALGGYFLVNASQSDEPGSGYLIGGGLSLVGVSVIIWGLVRLFSDDDKYAQIKEDPVLGGIRVEATSESFHIGYSYSF